MDAKIIHYDMDAAREAQHDKLKAENKRLKEALEWQPIETAPKDGTDILVADPTQEFSQDRVERARYWEGKWCVVNAYYFLTDLSKIEEISKEQKLDDMPLYIISPTHWMPLPEPPKENE